MTACIRSQSAGTPQSRSHHEQARPQASLPQGQGRQPRQEAQQLSTAPPVEGGRTGSPVRPPSRWSRCVARDPVPRWSMSKAARGRASRPGPTLVEVQGRPRPSLEIWSHAGRGARPSAAEPRDPVRRIRRLTRSRGPSQSSGHLDQRGGLEGPRRARTTSTNVGVSRALAELGPPRPTCGVRPAGDLPFAVTLLDGLPIAAHQCLALPARPPLDLLLPRIGLGDAVRRLSPAKRDGQPTTGVLRSLARRVLLQPGLEVPCAADVVGAIGAFEDVDVGHVLIAHEGRGGGGRFSTGGRSRDSPGLEGPRRARATSTNVGGLEGPRRARATSTNVAGPPRPNVGRGARSLATSLETW